MPRTKAIRAKPKPKAAKPAAFRLGRSAVFEHEQTATCTAWECNLPGTGGGVECGRAVEVPAACFDESDADRMRRLALWLIGAAKWVERTK